MQSIVSNLKLITSGETPTLDNLPQGYAAFGYIDGKLRLYGNANGTTIDVIIGGENVEIALSQHNTDPDAHPNMRIDGGLI